GSPPFNPHFLGVKRSDAKNLYKQLKLVKCRFCWSAGAAVGINFYYCLNVECFQKCKQSINIAHHFLHTFFSFHLLLEKYLTTLHLRLISLLPIRLKYLYRIPALALKTEINFLFQVLVLFF